MKIQLSATMQSDVEFLTELANAGGNSDAVGTKDQKITPAMYAREIVECFIAEKRLTFAKSIGASITNKTTLKQFFSNEENRRKFTASL